MNPNESGMIYYGTDIQFLKELDEHGLSKPRYRNEQYISVCISGYRGKVKCEHPDLLEFARIYSQELNIATFDDGYINFKSGYMNSLTYQQGFGPNPNKYHHTFYGLTENTRTRNTVTAVVSQEAQKYLVIPDKEREFEYLSLALHGFIKDIDQSLIVGWILPDDRVNEVEEMMSNGNLKHRKIWSECLFSEYIYDTTKSQRYGCFPSDIRLYVKDVSKNEFCKPVRIEHLRRVIGDLVDIDWDSDFENELNNWLDKNEDKIKWNSKEFIYQCVCGAIV